MSKYFLLFFFIFSGYRAQCSVQSIAVKDAAVPKSVLAGHTLSYLSTPNFKEVENLLGRKLKLKEKIAIKLYQRKIKNGRFNLKENSKKDKGQTALLLGIIGIASLLIPVFGILSFLVCTILALVLGYQAKKENPEDRKARTAILIAWIGVGLFIAASVIAIAILSNWVK